MTGDVEWPRDDDGPRPVPPHGVEYHYAVLGVLDANGTVTHPPDTFEPLFRAGPNPVAPEPAPAADPPKKAAEIDAPPVAHPADSVVFEAEKSAGARAPQPKEGPTRAGAGGNGSALSASSTHPAETSSPGPKPAGPFGPEATVTPPTAFEPPESSTEPEKPVEPDTTVASSTALEPPESSTEPEKPSGPAEPDTTATSSTALEPPEPSTKPEKSAMPQPTTQLGDRLTSWLRTVVPGLWSALVAWLVSLGLPASVTDAVAGLGNQIIVPLVLAVVYALLRQLEPQMPPWLTRVLLGSNRSPSYAETEAGHALG